MSMSSRRVFMKQIGFGVAGLGMLSAMRWEDEEVHLPYSSPEEQGLSWIDISKFLDAVKASKIEFHSIMIVRHGFNIFIDGWHPYSPGMRHKLYSLSKSFTSTAIGMAVAEGKLTVEDSVLSFFPDEKPKEVSANLAAMKIKHLLTMTSGHAKDTIPALRGSPSAASWAQLFLDLPVEFEPGTHFVYNTGATYMLSAILQKITGHTLYSYLRPRLFIPLGIQDADWETDPQGITTGGYGLRITTEDIAKFGQLYLQKGKWNGKQLLTEQWVADATRAQVKSTPANFTGGPLPDGDWTQGYGYQFWRNQPMGFRADGAFGQFCLVLPEKDAVVAITSESFNLQASLKLIWDNLLPALKDSPIVYDKQTLKSLRNLTRSQSLILPNVQQPSSPLTAKISGREITLKPNALKVYSLSLEFAETPFQKKSKTKTQQCTLHVHYEDGTTYYAIAGVNEWITTGGSEIPPFAIKGRTDVPSVVSGSVTWADDKTLVLTRRMTETPHGDELEFNFDGDNVTIKFMNSISANNPAVPEDRQDLKGRIA
jgi:CubicO group peptidase (beta-lactamase class C family)